MATTLLELQRVSMAFGGLNVVSDLDLHVDEGEIVSVIGPNGAGKTTLFNLITGVYEPIHGDIVFASESIVGLEPHRITRKGIARTFQTLRLFLNMTVRENVMAAAYGHTTAGPFRRCSHPGPTARRAGDPGARRGAARVLRRAADRVQVGSAGLLALLREPAAARNRPRHGDQAAPAAARRACRGYEPEGNAGDHRADRQAAHRRRVHDPRDRARHARRRGDLRSRRRARPRRQDRGGHVRGGRDRPAGGRGVPRDGRTACK